MSVVARKRSARIKNCRRQGGHHLAPKQVSRRKRESFSHALVHAKGLCVPTVRSEWIDTTAHSLQHLSSRNKISIDGELSSSSSIPSLVWSPASQQYCQALASDLRAASHIARWVPLRTADNRTGSVNPQKLEVLNYGSERNCIASTTLSIAWGLARFRPSGRKWSPSKFRWRHGAQGACKTIYSSPLGCQERIEQGAPVRISEAIFKAHTLTKPRPRVDNT